MTLGGVSGDPVVASPRHPTASSAASKTVAAGGAVRERTGAWSGAPRDWRGRSKLKGTAGGGTRGEKAGGTPSEEGQASGDRGAQDRSRPHPRNHISGELFAFLSLACYRATC